MRFVRFALNGREGLAVKLGSELRGFMADEAGYPGSLDTIVAGKDIDFAAASEALARGNVVDQKAISYLPPFSQSRKIICVGLNYHDHTAESGYVQPKYPTIFARFQSSLIGHNDDIVRPQSSDTLDFEGELVAVVGRGGTKISEADALSHIVGYSIFNDGSVREFQHATPQWTVGKNFDSTGAFGPEFVTADELPPGCKGLLLETRLNGQVVQRANIDDMVFSVSALVSILSQTMTLEPGDIIVTGTPAGVGAGRKPPLYMKHGDVCEVEIERVGLLLNGIRDEVVSGQVAA